MNHEELFREVKAEYARMASDASQWTFLQSTATPTPEMYYEMILNRVLRAIEAGKFDSFHSGAEIVAAVQQNPDQWLQ